MRWDEKGHSMQTQVCWGRETESLPRHAQGVLRVHQFDKVEQFMLCQGGDASWRAMDEMLGIAEEFYSSLNIPYR
eukprot:gene22064-29129_t